MKLRRTVQTLKRLKLDEMCILITFLLFLSSDFKSERSIEVDKKVDTTPTF